MGGEKMKSGILWLTSFASLLTALYCVAGVLQGAMLFTGSRARSNVELWGTLFVIFTVIFLGSTVLLWRGRKK